ncbi:hypothetical protein ACFE04_019135 [Oxalis oulophora]
MTENLLRIDDHPPTKKLKKSTGKDGKRKRVHEREVIFSQSKDKNSRCHHESPSSSRSSESDSSQEDQDASDSTGRNPTFSDLNWLIPPVIDLSTENVQSTECELTVSEWLDMEVAKVHNQEHGSSSGTGEKEQGFARNWDMEDHLAMEGAFDINKSKMDLNYDEMDLNSNPQEENLNGHHGASSVWDLGYEQ